ncbi:dynein regulatory complex protein 10 [Brachionichthys hirsutus]|uniref:dynein regulatory complex protein 10 n=1 Tax=Brachionichthys hirsutus TaxID=412623 RepID=UPI003604AA26
MSTNAESVRVKATIQCEPRKLSPDAQCISTILDDCICKVEIVAALDAFLQSSPLSGVVDETFRRALQEHLKLVERLKLQVGPKQNSDKEQKGEGNEAQLEKDIKSSVRNLLRHVRDHPDALIGLRAEPGWEIGESERSLISEFRKFQSHVSEKLQLSVEEEQELAHCKQVPPSTLANAEREVSEVLKKIQEMISEKDCVIKGLQSSLAKISTDPDKSARLDKRRQSIISTSKMKQSSIKKDIDELIVKCNNVCSESRNAERELQMKINKEKSETLQVIQNFDDKMEVLQAKLELNESEYKKEEEELRELQERFSVLEMECSQIQEKRRLAEEKRKQEMRELEVKTKAALLIQAWWRGYCARKALKKKGKGKGKGKGKKVKGKKAPPKK